MKIDANWWDDDIMSHVFTQTQFYTLLNTVQDKLTSLKTNMIGLVRGHLLSTNICNLEISIFFLQKKYKNLNQINSWFSAPPTTTMMMHYIIQISSITRVGSLEEEYFQGALESWRGTHQLEFCWQLVPCLRCSDEECPLTELQPGQTEKWWRKRCNRKGKFRGFAHFCDSYMQNYMGHKNCYKVWDTNVYMGNRKLLQTQQFETQTSRSSHNFDSRKTSESKSCTLHADTQYQLH